MEMPIKVKWIVVHVVAMLGSVAVCVTAIACQMEGCSPY